MADERSHWLGVLKRLSRKRRDALRRDALSLRDLERSRRSRRRKRSDDGPNALLEYEIRLLQQRAALSDEGEYTKGLVIGVYAGQCVVDVDGEEAFAALPRRIFEVQQSALAVGDWVRLTQNDDGQRVVADVLARRSSLSRPDPIHAGLQRVIVANIDVVVLVVTPDDPPFRDRLIDRMRVACMSGGAKLFVCLNKCDLAGAALDDARSTLETFDMLTLFQTSAETLSGISELRDALRGETFAFVGQSGVGKSSLANVLHPGLLLETGEVSEAIGKGRHTTTRATLHRLPDNTLLIDTPGVRGFGMWRVSIEQLNLAYDDIATLATRCRFNDCAHASEPDCAVRAAVEDGSLPVRRLDSYERLRTELDADERGSGPG
jgi:ribosome biogenesis GTPase